MVVVLSYILMMTALQIHYDDVDDGDNGNDDGDGDGDDDGDGD